MDANNNKQVDSVAPPAHTSRPGSPHPVALNVRSKSPITVESYIKQNKQIAALSSELEQVKLENIDLKQQNNRYKESSVKMLRRIASSEIELKKANKHHKESSDKMLRRLELSEIELKKANEHYKKSSDEMLRRLELSEMECKKVDERYKKSSLKMSQLVESHQIEMTDIQKKLIKEQNENKNLWKANEDLRNRMSLVDHENNELRDQILALQPRVVVKEATPPTGRLVADEEESEEEEEEEADAPKLTTGIKIKRTRSPSPVNLQWLDKNFARHAVKPGQEEKRLEEVYTWCNIDLGMRYMATCISYTIYGSEVSDKNLFLELPWKSVIEDIPHTKAVKRCLICKKLGRADEVAKKHLGMHIYSSHYGGALRCRVPECDVTLRDISALRAHEVLCKSKANNV